MLPVLPVAAAIGIALLVWATVAYARRGRSHSPAEIGEALTRARGHRGPERQVVFCNACGRREDRADAVFCRACGLALDSSVRR